MNKDEVSWRTLERWEEGEERGGAGAGAGGGGEVGGGERERD